MGRWRGYIVSEAIGKRLAMRSPHLKGSKAEAVSDIKRENREWESVNSSRHFDKTFNAYEVPDGHNHKYKPGYIGNRELLRWHDSQMDKKTAEKHGVHFGKGGNNRFVRPY